MLHSLVLTVAIFTNGQFFHFWLFFNILFLFFFFFSASCVSLVPETPPTALILDVPRGEPSPFLPQDPLSSADVTGVILKAPQVGLCSSVLFLNYGSQSVALTRSIHITWELVRHICLQVHPRTTGSKTLEAGPRSLCFNKPPKGFGCP